MAGLTYPCTHVPSPCQLTDRSVTDNLSLNRDAFHSPLPLTYRSVTTLNPFRINHLRPFNPTWHAPCIRPNRIRNAPNEGRGKSMENYDSPNTYYDYNKQAWVANGVYQACGHGPDCGLCYGTLHRGEQAPPRTMCTTYRLP